MTQQLSTYLFLLTATSLVIYLFYFGIKKLLSLRVGKLIKRPRNSWDDIVVATVERTSHIFMFVSGAYTAFYLLEHRRSYELYANRTFFIVLMVQIGLWANFLLDHWILSSISRRTRRNPAAASSISLLQLLTKVILISSILLFTLNNMGIKITTILAGLSVGGLAVALAVQKILGDLFSSLSIVMDKPFMVGDFIILGDYMGEVERIGLRTTLIRSLGGEQIIISNSDLLASRIRNYQRLKERRVHFVIPLSHRMDKEKMQTAVSLITSIASNKTGIRFERCHFTEIGRESLKIETVYWVLTDDYIQYLHYHQSILMEVHGAFIAEGILIATPSTHSATILPTDPPKPDFPAHSHRNLA